MRRGDFPAAWRVGDRTLGNRSEHLPRYLKPVWRGLSLDRKHVFIRCYRGLGDTIQFIRYAPLVRERASEVTVIAPSELLPLLHTMPAIDRLLALDRDRDPPSYDIEVEVTELPYIFRTRMETIPADAPYFDVAPAAHLSPGYLAVGIVWAAGDWDHRRSIPQFEIARLAAMSGVRFFSFQRGAAVEHSDPPFIELDWRDIIHEARLLRSLDLLISVDTMPAHLAGALGVPVWLLLHADPDWRWMEDRNDSPWYPTMRLFRQDCAGDWRSVLERVADELRALRAARRDYESLVGYFAGDGFRDSLSDLTNLGRPELG